MRNEEEFAFKKRETKHSRKIRESARSCFRVGLLPLFIMKIFSRCPTTTGTTYLSTDIYLGSHLASTSIDLSPRLFSLLLLHSFSEGRESMAHRASNCDSREFSNSFNFEGKLIQHTLVLLSPPPSSKERLLSVEILSFIEFNLCDYEHEKGEYNRNY